MSEIIRIVKVHNLRSIEKRNLRLAGNFKTEISHRRFFGNFTKVIKKRLGPDTDSDTDNDFLYPENPQ